MTLLVLGGAVRDPGQGGATGPGGEPGNVVGYFAGSWRGIVVDSLAGRGTLEMDIDQQEAKIGGVWRARFPTSGQANHGALDGVVAGAKVSVWLYSALPGACPLVASGRLTENRVVGEYEARDCPQPILGTFELTRL